MMFKEVCRSNYCTCGNWCSGFRCYNNGGRVAERVIVVIVIKLPKEL